MRYATSLLVLLGIMAAVGTAGDSRAQPLRLALQVYLLSVAAVYFVWS